MIGHNKFLKELIVILFPNILITISIPRTGEQAGFLLTKENENFGIFFPDIPPEEWEEDTEFEKI